MVDSACFDVAPAALGTTTHDICYLLALRGSRLLRPLHQHADVHGHSSSASKHSYKGSTARNRSTDRLRQNQPQRKAGTTAFHGLFPEPGIKSPEELTVAIIALSLRLSSLLVLSVSLLSSSCSSLLLRFLLLLPPPSLLLLLLPCWGLARVQLSVSDISRALFFLQ